MQSVSIKHVFWFLLFSGLLFCASPEAVVVSAHMSIRDYQVFVRKLPSAEGSQEAPIGMAFPILGIFDSRGELIFIGNGVSANMPMLRQSQCGLAQTGSRPRPFNLGKIVDQVKEFSAYKVRLLSGKRCTYLSISLEKCEACEAQDDLFEKFGNSGNIVNKLSLVLGE